MNDLIVTHQDVSGEIIVSGRDLHTFLGIGTEYKKWFGRMLEYDFSEGIDYQRVSQKCPTLGGIQERVDHQIKLDMAKEISMIQRTDRGKQARQYFLQLEKMWNSPEMVMKRALEYADRKVLELKTQMEADRPKVLFAEALETSNNSILIGELAKLLKQNGINIGQNRLFAALRNEGYLIRRRGESYNAPTQRSMDMGLMEIKKSVINTPNGPAKSTTTSKVTGKGQLYFVNKFLEGSIEA